MLNNKNIINLIMELGRGDKVKMEYAREINESLSEKLILEADRVWLSISKNTNGENIWWTNAVKVTGLTINDIIEQERLVGIGRTTEFLKEYNYKIVDNKLICKLTMCRYKNEFLDDVLAEKYESLYEVDNVNYIINIISRNLSNIKFEK